MVCVYCRFPLDIPAPPESDKLKRVGNVPSWACLVRCTHCLAKFQFDLFVDNEPEVTQNRLREIRNRIS